MKKKVIILWCAFVVCLITTVALWFAMNNSKLKYEEVEATVLSSEVEQVVNKKTGSRTNFYKVKVEYNGEEYDLGNVHSASGHSRGKRVKAYLSNEKLYANIEGVRTATPVATIYFVFLFGTFGMLFWAAIEMGKLSQNKKQEQEQEN